MQSGHVAFLTLAASQCFKDKEHVHGPQQVLRAGYQFMHSELLAPSLTLLLHRCRG